MTGPPPRERKWFTPAEITYLDHARLGRLATLDGNGSPQNKPVSFTINPADSTIDITGHSLASSAKYRNILRDPRVAFVVDDLGGGTYTTVRGIEVRGQATAISYSDTPETDHGAMIRVTPERILSWNINDRR